MRKACSPELTQGVRPDVAKLGAVAVLAIVALVEVPSAAAKTPPAGPGAVGTTGCAPGLCGPPSHGAALQRLARAAAQGDPEAAFRLGALFASGTHLAKDLARAEELWRRAAERDHVQAQHHLGLIMLGDDETNQRVDEGLAWLGAAAAQGDALSAIVLGMLHERGLHGVRRNVCLALDWYEAGELLGGRGPPQYVAALKANHAAACD